MNSFTMVFVKLVVVVALAASLAGPAQGRVIAASNYYVATTGNDSSDCLSPATP
jgi:hypothetical protein